MTAGSGSYRSAEDIIADWLVGFTGGIDDDLERRRPEAESIVRWLRDEGWEITRKDDPDNG